MAKSFQEILNQLLNNAYNQGQTSAYRTFYDPYANPADAFGINIGNQNPADLAEGPGLVYGQRPFQNPVNVPPPKGAGGGTTTTTGGGGGGGGGGGSASADYAALAAAYGRVAPNPAQVASLIAGNVSPAEFQLRLEASNTIKNNKVALAQWNDVLIHQGLTKKPMTYQEQLQFVYGQAPGSWYTSYKNWSTQFGLTEAGLDIGTDIARSTVRYIEGLLPSGATGTNFAQTYGNQYRDLAQNIRNTIPAGRRQGIGITDAMLAQMEFGGPQSAAYSEIVGRVLRNDQAFFTSQRARSATAQPQRGEQAPPLGSY